MQRYGDFFLYSGEFHLITCEAFSGKHHREKSVISFVNESNTHLGLKDRRWSWRGSKTRVCVCWGVIKTQLSPTSPRFEPR